VFKPLSDVGALPIDRLRRSRNGNLEKQPHALRDFIQKARFLDVSKTEFTPLLAGSAQQIH
jgi:hypothetical protein